MDTGQVYCSRVLFRILKKGVKCCFPEKVEFYYTFVLRPAKSGSQRQNVGVKCSKFGVIENSV